MQRTPTPEERPKEAAPAIRIPYDVLVGTAAGALLMYFLDPQQGRHRRTMLRDRSGAFVRRAGRSVEHMGKSTVAEAYGVKQKMTHLWPDETEAPNDPDLVARVESAIYRNPDIPKGNINLNAVHEDTVIVRGEVADRSQIRTIRRAIKRVHGVRRVENLLHLPGTLAPNKADAIEASH